MQTEAGLEALETALSSGFEQYSKVRNDPNLEALRKSPKFKGIIDKYDEPLINDNAIKCACSPYASACHSTGACMQQTHAWCLPATACMLREKCVIVADGLQACSCGAGR